MDDVEFFAKVKVDDKCPEGMSVFEWKRLKAEQETEAYLLRTEPKRERLEDLQARGLVFPAIELAAREQAERQAAIEMQNAIEEQQREQRHQKPKPAGSQTPGWTREKL